MSQRIVIHRDWTFTYDGRDFSIIPGGSGYGHEVIEQLTNRTVRSGYDTLSEVRLLFPEHYTERWEQDDYDADRPH